MSTILDQEGGPAFPLPPCSDGHVSWDKQGGMSLRQWYAGLAMQQVANQFGRLPDTRAKLAEDCFAIADAMIRHEHNERVKVETIGDRIASLEAERAVLLAEVKARRLPNGTTDDEHQKRWDKVQASIEAVNALNLPELKGEL